ncbi:hypothetical protein J4P02_29725 [Pseudomonas sp. NFXW11]|uniref:hypothetical protein n=1 Tax=Pseudomonas sp. NFXW11 TaxID=2819531 RepID=UPI003CF10BCE
MTDNSKELRSNFEKQLQAFLKDGLSGRPGIKVTKNKVTISQKESGAVATLNFAYLSNSRAYETIILVEAPSLQAELERIKPPYPSNLPNPKFVYSMSTVSEQDACPLLPVTEQGIATTCQLILKRIVDVYLPLINKLLSLHPGLVEDVLSRPQYYCYPVPLIFLALNHSGARPDQATLARILSEQTLGYTNHLELKTSFNQQLLATLA